MDYAQRTSRQIIKGFLWQFAGVFYHETCEMLMLMTVILMLMVMLTMTFMRIPTMMSDDDSDDNDDLFR